MTGYNDRHIRTTQLDNASSGSTCGYDPFDGFITDNNDYQETYTQPEEVTKVLKALNYAWVVALLGFYWHKIFYKSQTRRMRPEGYPSGFV